MRIRGRDDQRDGAVVNALRAITSTNWTSPQADESTDVLVAFFKQDPAKELFEEPAAGPKFLVDREPRRIDSRPFAQIDFFGLDDTDVGVLMTGSELPARTAGYRGTFEDAVEFAASRLDELWASFERYIRGTVERIDRVSVDDEDLLRVLARLANAISSQLVDGIPDSEQLLFEVELAQHAIAVAESAKRGHPDDLATLIGRRMIYRSQVGAMTLAGTLDAGSSLGAMDFFPDRDLANPIEFEIEFLLRSPVSLTGASWTREVEVGTDILPVPWGLIRGRDVDHFDIDDMVQREFLFEFDSQLKAIGREVVLSDVVNRGNIVNCTAVFFGDFDEQDLPATGDPSPKLFLGPEKIIISSEDQTSVFLDGNRVAAASSELARVLFDDSEQMDSDELVEVLDSAQTADVVAALEHPVGLTQGLLDASSGDEVDEFTEGQIRSLLEQLALEYRKPKGPDGRQIRSFVGQIVSELLELRVFGEHARDLLTQLGGRPPEAVDAVVSNLEQAADFLATNWAVLSDEEETVDVVTNPVQHLEQASSSVEEIEWSVDAIADDFKKSLRKKIPDRMADGAIGFGTLTLASVGSYLYDKFGFDPVVVIMDWLNSLPELQYSLTTKAREQRTDAQPGQDWDLSAGPDEASLLRALIDAIPSEWGEADVVKRLHSTFRLSSHGDIVVRPTRRDVRDVVESIDGFAAVLTEDSEAPHVRVVAKACLARLNSPTTKRKPF